jgi:hypothetical protein
MWIMTTTVRKMFTKKKYYEQDNKKTLFYLLYPKLPKPSYWVKPHLKRQCKFLLP